MRFTTVSGAIGLALLVSACGTSQEQRASTGALTGAGIGALAGGPLGLVIGGLAGGAAGAATPVGADQVAFWGMDKTRDLAQSTPVLREMASENVGERGVSGSSTPQRMTGTSAGGSEADVATLRVSPDVVKQIQSSLQAQGLYRGPIDGIVGPQTEDALSAYRQKQGLQQSAGLDAQTLQSLISGSGGSPAAANRPAANNPPSPGGR